MFVTGTLSPAKSLPREGVSDTALPGAPVAGGLRHLFVSLWSLTSAARGLCLLTVMNGSTAPHSTALQVAAGDAVLFASMFTPGICRNSAWMSFYTQIHAPDGAGGSHGGEEEPELAAVQASAASQISFQVAVALQKWHGMCWGCVCVTELASKGQLQWKRGISLCAVYGDTPEPGSWALGFRQLRAVHVERVTEREQRGWEWLLLRFIVHLYGLNLLSLHSLPLSVKKIGADPQVQPYVYKRLFNLR